MRAVVFGLGACLIALLGALTAAEAAERPIKRVLLVGQGPDGHAWSTHEYMAGVNLLAKLLSRTERLQPIVVRADGEWPEGPELIDGADAVVLFVAEGAKWMQGDPARLVALQKLARRGGGIVGLHWAIGCRDAQYIDEAVRLIGGCHGGPDRKYKIVDVTARLPEPAHPVVRGIEPFQVEDEFYYQLKFTRPADGLTPLVQVPIEGEPHTVAWAWERPGGGRSFGFSGGHFHRNWALKEYRRLVTQAVLWTLDQSIPESGLPVVIAEQDLELTRPREK